MGANSARRTVYAARSIAALATLAVLSAPAPRAAAEPRADPVAFERVAVIPMDRERVLRDQTVVVRDGRIAAMGPSAAVQIPAGATRVDGRGRWLMPGLADMHVHLYNADQLVDFLAHGVTTVAVLNGSRPVLEWRRQIASGALLGPAIYSAGPSLDGTPAGNPQFLSIATPDDGRAAVRLIAAEGFDFVKVYMTLTPETYAAILDEARLRRLAVVGHIPPQVGVDGVVASRGQSVVAHAEEFFREPVDSARRAARMLEIVHGVKAAGMTVIPNMSAYADYLRAIDDLPGVLADPEMRYASSAAYTEKLPAHHRSVRPNPQQFRVALVRGLATFRTFTNALSDSGVPLLLGTDTEIFGFAGASLHEEMREMRAAGLRPYQVLAAGTSAAGDWVGSHVRGAEPFGRITPGARADLVLLTANPLDDVANARRIEGVMVRGRWLPVARLHALRDSLARRQAPLRVLAARFDSLVHVGKLDDAEATLMKLRRAHGGYAPVAFVVTRVDARRLMQTDPAAAVRLLEWNASMFPDMHAAHTELARGYLARGAPGDSARAVAAARRALAMYPTHATAKAIVTGQ